MAKFNVDDFDELDITPSEFIDGCNTRELKELVDLITETSAFQERFSVDDFGNITEIDINEIRSYGTQLFIHNLMILKNSCSHINKEDEEIINLISKKYGGKIY